MSNPYPASLLALSYLFDFFDLNYVAGVCSLGLTSLDSGANQMPVDVADARWLTDLLLSAPSVLWTLQMVPRP